MQAGKDYAIVPFDPMKHTAFLFDSFRKSLIECWNWKAVPPRLLIERMKKHIRTPGVVTRMAVGIPDENILLGWACCRPSDNEVVYAFVKYEQRRLRVGTSLVREAGVDLGQQTGVLYWSHAAQRIAQRPKYRLHFRVTDEAERLAVAPKAAKTTKAVVQA
jgi:hypothetical protein